MKSAREIGKYLHKLLVGYAWRAQYLLPMPLPPGFDDDLVATIKSVRRHTLTMPWRLAALCDGIEYVVKHGVPGAIVECGVWRGGCMMAAATTLLRHGVRDRDLYLYDTFRGMTEPTAEDAPSAYDGYSLHRRWLSRQRDGINTWNYAPVGAVRAALESTGYDPARIHMVEGKVEETTPAHAPDQIALLRLDTDWYQSTKHELIHLYPRLVEGGVLIIDDYGHYEGARRAVDEYFESTGEPIFLSRTDYTGRIAIKQRRVAGP